MAASSHRSPCIVRPDGSVAAVKRVYLGQGREALDSVNQRELFLQDLVFRSPCSIPMEEIEKGLTPMISICTELPVGGTYLDNLWMTPDGGIILGECKLVRNPQSRREVLVQALDYASTMATWSFEDLERAAATRTGGAKLWDLVKQPGNDDPDSEAEFADAVQRRLRDGQFMILLILDGVQDGLETLHAYLQQHAGLHVNVAIVELSLWTGIGDDLLVVPRVPLKTQLVERGIVVSGVGNAIRIVEPKGAGEQALPRPYTASEAEFYDRLEQKAPGVKERLKDFLASLGDIGISPEFQRSAILRWVVSPELQGSVGYVDSYGAVWVSDGYYSAKKFGNEPAGRAYVEEVAAAIGGSVRWPTEGNSYLAVRGGSGKTARIDELLDHSAAWRTAIRKLVSVFRPGGSDTPETGRPQLDDRKCLEVLASFAPRLREPGASFGSMGPNRGSGQPGDPTQIPSFQFSPLGDDFHRSMYEWGWVSTDFDYPEWSRMPEAEALRGSPEAIKTATPDQLLKLMTVLLRGERWMEGALAESFEKGLLLAASERAKSILDSGGPLSGDLRHYAFP